MSKILSLLLASAALTAGLGVPAWSAMHLPQQGAAVTPMSAVLGSTDTAELLVLVDDDDDDDEDEGEDATFGSFEQVGADMGPVVSAMGLGIQGRSVDGLSGRLGAVGALNSNGYQFGLGGELSW